MTEQELRQALKHTWYAHIKYEQELERLELLRSRAAKCTPAYSLTPGGGGAAQGLESAVARIIEQEKKIAENCGKLLLAEQNAEKLINLLPDCPAKIVMCRRYLNHEKWEQIAKHMAYTWQHVHRLHKRGVKMILAKVNRKRKIQTSEQNLFE